MLLHVIFINAFLSIIFLGELHSGLFGTRMSRQGRDDYPLLAEKLIVKRTDPRLYANLRQSMKEAYVGFMFMPIVATSLFWYFDVLIPLTVSTCWAPCLGILLVACTTNMLMEYTLKQVSEQTLAPYK